MATLVEVLGVSRRFGSTLALAGVDFRADAGLVYGLVGVNGAGKTTLIKHLLGLLRPQTGQVRVFGLDPVRDPVAVLGRVGYLSEQRDLPEWMRLDELLRYTQAYHPAWDAAYANELVENFGLERHKKFADLSQGMRAQAGLVLAVAHRPELLILDEPSSGLDVVVRHDILDAIVRTVAQDGRTVIFSSHLLDEVERMCDHVTMMDHGKVALSGPLDEVRGAHRVSQVRFPHKLDRRPNIQDALSIAGDGRSWSVVHESSLESLRENVAQIAGQVTESRNASLEEIFVARVGRVKHGDVAA
jgi:ABC-2 type transport system ATP-binding protein